MAEMRLGDIRSLEQTATYQALQSYIEENEIGFVAIDNASDTFDGDEIKRSSVRTFMRALGQLVHERGGAVLLLAHVDKLAARGLSSETYSGSTAWHNSAGSRMTLTLSDDGRSLTLTHNKCSYGPKLDPIHMVISSDGVPMLEQALSPVVQHIKNRVDLKAVLALIHEFTGRGEFVAAGTTSTANATRILSREKSYPKLKPAEVHAMLRDAEREGHVERVTYKGADRHTKERWGITQKGLILIGAGTAGTAGTSEDDADAAVPAELAGTAGTSAGGYGGPPPHIGQAGVAA
jgi:hypothetical protein